MAIEHNILVAGGAVAHLYATSPGIRQRIDEAKQRGQPLTGVYTYRKDKPPPKGQYHLHIFEKNNELFAINWNGTAHDKNHNKVIPLTVYDALREKFPTLVLPDRNSRVIESVNPQLFVEPVESPSCRTVTPDELLGLKALIEAESREYPTIDCEPYSKVQFFYGSYILRCGQPLLIAAAQHSDDGGMDGEAHLFWFPPGIEAMSRQGFHRRREQTETLQEDRGNTVGGLLEMGREWAVGEVAHIAQECWRQAGKTGTPPPAGFTEGTVYDVLRLWVFGRARQSMEKVRTSEGNYSGAR